MNTKSIIASRTLWINVIAIIAASLGAFNIDVGLTPEVQVALVGGIIAAINVVMRFFTKKSLTITKQS